MPNLKDKRAITSADNGAKGGRPAKADFSSVAKVLLHGLHRLASIEKLHLEATDALAVRRLINKARALCAGFDEVISQSRSEYLKRLDKLGSPNPVTVRDQLRRDLNAISREVREALRIISAKAEVLLQDAEELAFDLSPDLKEQLQRLAQIETRSLDKIVAMIVGIVEESLDRFGVPINS